MRFIILLGLYFQCILSIFATTESVAVVFIQISTTVSAKMKSKSGSKQISQNPQSGRKGKNKNGAKSKQNNANDKNKASGATVPTDDFSWEAAGSNGLVTNAVPKSVICENKEGSIDNSRSVSNQMYQQMNSYPPYYTPANVSVFQLHPLYLFIPNNFFINPHFFKKWF